MLLGLHYGFGHHIQYVPPLDIRDYIIVSAGSQMTSLGRSLTTIQTLFVFFLLQTITTALIKIAILMLYKRAFTAPRFQTAVWIVGAIVIANSLGVCVAVCNFCHPIARFWDPMGVPGHCINEVVATTLFSTTLFITDVIIYIMPMPMIWNLRMTRRRKVEMSLVFLIGFLYVMPKHFLS